MPKRFIRRPKSSWSGLVGGLISGLAATIVMTQCQNAWSKASKLLADENRGRGSSTDAPEDATMKAAGKFARLAGRELSYDTRKKSGPFIHYGFGTAMGALYGLAKERTPRRSWTNSPLVSGTIFGTALFVGADEVAVPALGLSGKPSEFPLSAHAYGLASHLVYGVTVGFVHDWVRRRL